MESLCARIVQAIRQRTRKTPHTGNLKAIRTCSSSAQCSEYLCCDSGSVEGESTDDVIPTDASLRITCQHGPRDDCHFVPGTGLGCPILRSMASLDSIFLLLLFSMAHHVQTAHPYTVDRRRTG